MAKTDEKIILPAALGLAIIFFVCTAAPAASPSPSADRILQPQALNYCGIYELALTEPNLTGSGVKFAVLCRSTTYADGEPQNDYRPDTTNSCFSKSNFSFHDYQSASAGISPHSTAVCSILFGSDGLGYNSSTGLGYNSSTGPFEYRSIVPSAKADIYEFWYFLTNYVYPHRTPDADIITASFGTQFDCWWTRGIDSLAETAGLPVVAGIGNGLDAHDSVLYPAAGANCIAVGVIDSVNVRDPAINLSQFSLARPEHSSFGPTPDGRCKPDIVAPGNCLAAVEPNRYEPAGNWSSFSAPVVAGAVGLLIQKARQQPELSDAISPDGGGCVIKAIVLNSADKLPYWHKGRPGSKDDHQVPLDYIQGAGALNAINAYRQLISGHHKPGSAPSAGWDKNTLSAENNRWNAYRISIPAAKAKTIAATLVWNRHYSRSYPFEPLTERDANLRLEMWAVDANEPANDYLLDYSDSPVDNVEDIYCRTDPNYTDYELVVEYGNSSDSGQPAGSSELYGLAWNAGDTAATDSIFLYDLNADGTVSTADFTILFDNWVGSISRPDDYHIGDINGDGVIDEKDFQLMMDHFTTSTDQH